jgi:hypothetical protein
MEKGRTVTVGENGYSVCSDLNARLLAPDGQVATTVR